jgi:hypothetical protein
MEWCLVDGGLAGWPVCGWWAQLGNEGVEGQGVKGLGVVAHGTGRQARRAPRCHGVQPSVRPSSVSRYYAIILSRPTGRPSRSIHINLITVVAIP